MLVLSREPEPVVGEGVDEEREGENRRNWLMQLGKLTNPSFYSESWTWRPSRANCVALV